MKKVLEESVQTETVFESKEKENANQLKLKKEKKLATEQEQARLQEAFRKDREAQLAEMLSSAKDADWKAFAAWAEENPYIKAKVLKNGRISRRSKEVREWFKSFLEEQLPREEEAFKVWLAKQ